MLKKAILALATCASFFLLCFAVYNYRQAAPVAEENLRGLALSITAAIENIAVHDPSLAGLAKFRTSDIAYFALVDSRGTYRFHSNPDLIGKKMQGGSLSPDLTKAPPSEGRLRLGTGERAFQFTTPLYLPDQTLALRLVLHTYRADAVIRWARFNATILLVLLMIGWLLLATVMRYAKREERHQIELASKRSLAKLGEMGAVLAHEIRNPLSGIKGFAQVIAKTPVAQRNSAFAQSIVAEVVRLENLVTDLLAYASADPSPRAPFDLAELMDHTVSLLAAAALEAKVDVESCCAPNLSIMGNRDRLEQALLNLGQNALQAMQEGGTLQLRAVPAGSDVVLTVSDSGSGIAEEDLQRVFEPFFTTKARGTGLGLALSKKVVEEHDGSIAISSDTDGTTVTINLPLSMRDGTRRSC